MVFLSLQPALYIFLFFSSLIIFRLLYALLVLVTTGKIYDASSSFFNENFPLHPRKILFGKNFYGIFRDNTIFTIMALTSYYSIAALTLVKEAWLYTYPQSLYGLIAITVSLVLICGGYMNRKRKLKRINFTKTLNGEAPESFFRVVSDD